MASSGALSGARTPQTIDPRPDCSCAVASRGRDCGTMKSGRGLPVTLGITLKSERQLIVWCGGSGSRSSP